MDLDPQDIVVVFDRIGIVAFALSGVEVGMRRRLDVFGLLVMGLVTSVGGGAIRDVLLGNVPFVLERADYLLWAVAATVLAIAIMWRGRKIPRKALAIADAVGLGAFAAAGAIAGIAAGVSMLAVVLLAVITATGGGVIRDLLADRVPMILRTEVNATAAAIGGLVVWAVEPFGVGVAALTGALVAATIRILSIAYNINLPVPGRGRQGRLL